MTVSFKRRERRNFSDVGDAFLMCKRADEVFPWSHDWANQDRDRFLSQISQQIAYCKVYDVSALSYRDINERSWLDFTQWAVFPGTTQANDAILFGNEEPFEAFTIDTPSTLGTYGGDALTWEYNNGTAWTALTLIRDETDTTAYDGKRSFQGGGEIRFTAPTDWAKTTVDGKSAYWIRARVSTAANITAVAILIEHLSTIFVASADYDDEGTTRTNEAISGSVTSCNVTDTGEFECTVTMSTGEIRQGVWRFWEPNCAQSTDYQ